LDGYAAWRAEGGVIANRVVMGEGLNACNEPDAERPYQTNTAMAAIPDYMDSCR
jgi:hypothetical protein